MSSARYVPIIGLEIHAELTTESKLMCRCANTSSDLNTPPNTAICPTCVGLPGALPVINRAAIQATVRLGQSLGASIPDFTKWDRKNYFYPDLPKGYQISQYDQPVCQGGTLAWKDSEGTQHSIELTRIHLEEDTGKLVHRGGDSFIDYNRSSIPLLELVTEPVISSAKEARQFSEEYQHHLRDLGVAEANMEKGQMRCEANISVVPEELANDPAKRLSGTKVEVKNLNSFRSLERAIDFEIARQSAALEKGETLTQETRGWNDAKGETYVMRKKETADDYRYFPEPDLSRFDLREMKAAQQSGGSRSDLIRELEAANASHAFITIVVNDPARRDYLVRLRDGGLENAQLPIAVQWLSQDAVITKFEPSEIIEAFGKLTDKSISAAVFKQAIGAARPGALGDELSENGSGDSDEIVQVIRDVLFANEAEVARYQAGEAQLFGFFVGQVRKALAGKGDPAIITEELKRQLSATS